MLATNVIVDARLDANFAKDSGARNREKRHYYYSADIPARDEVSPLYIALSLIKGINNFSPRKRGRPA
jgi:hypothetical protein